MLYLNVGSRRFKKSWFKFNFNKCCIWMWEVEDLRKAGLNLTLTNVVFEFSMHKSLYSGFIKFNFNKCCIWMFYKFL